MRDVERLTWHEMRERYGRDEARRLLAAKLRAFADAVEIDSDPGVFDAEVEAPGEPPTGTNRTMESITVTLSHPWGG